MQKLFGPEIHRSWFITAIVAGVVVGNIGIRVIPGMVFRLSLGLVLFLELIVLIMTLFSPRRNLIILILLLGVGVAIARFYPLKEAEEIVKTQTGIVLVEGKVMMDPESRPGKVVVKLGKLKINQRPIAGTMLVMLKKVGKISRSEKIILEGTVSEGEGAWIGIIKNAKIIDRKRDGPDYFWEVKEALAKKIRMIIPEPASGLGLGYLLGVKSSLPRELNELLRTVGLVHIIVASGTHLGILVGFSEKIFGRYSRKLGLISSLMMLLGFIGIIGPTPSILRAGTSTSLSLVANYFGRKFEPRNLILLTAAITLFYDPNFLISLGWILSFGAYVGIVLISPKIKAYFYGKEKVGVVGETLINTIAANLVCTPILLYFFGTVSAISLLANVLILPTIAACIGLILATGILGFLVPILGHICGQLANLILNYHLIIVRILGEQKAFLVEISPGNIFVLSPLLLLLPLVFNFKRKINEANLDEENSFI